MYIQIIDIYFKIKNDHNNNSLIINNNKYQQ
jgi:hypothetical protein